MAQGYLDLMKIEERNAFLRRMHRLVVARIGKKNREAEEMFSRKDVEGSGSAGVEPGWTEKANPYERIWAAEEEKKTEELDDADKEAIEKIFGAKEKEEEKEEKKK